MGYPTAPELTISQFLDAIFGPIFRGHLSLFVRHLAQTTRSNGNSSGLSLSQSLVGQDQPENLVYCHFVNTSVL